MNERDQEGEPQISPLRAFDASVEMTNLPPVPEKTAGLRFVTKK